jgi:hypothetical protein
MQTAAMALITGRVAGAGLDAGALDVGALDVGTLISGDPRVSAEERVAVYARMYRARISETLAAQFPRLARLLGADEFAALSTAYIGDEPSRHPSLRFLGQRLPGWLARRRPGSPVAGLAALEWARADVFDLADDRALTLEAVRDWPPDRLGELPLRLVTAHRLPMASAGTARLWDSLGTADASDAGDHSSGDHASGGPVESFIVWRQGTVVYHRLVDDGERAALGRAVQGTSFGAVCDGLVEHHREEEALARAFAWMSTWLADGLLLAPDQRV